MPANIEKSRSGKPSLAKRGAAVAVVIVVGFLVITFVAHVIVTIITIAAVIVAIAAILWAANTLL